MTVFKEIHFKMTEQNSTEQMGDHLSSKWDWGTILVVAFGEKLNTFKHSR